MAQFGDLPALTAIQQELILDGLLQSGGNGCLAEAGALREFVFGHGLEQAKAIHEIFERQLIGSDGPALIQIGSRRVQIALGMLDFYCALNDPGRSIRQFAMGAAADTQIVTEAPIVQIVSALKPGLGIGRNFVLSIAGRQQEGMALLLDIP